MVQGGFLSILSTDYIKLEVMGLKTTVRLWKIRMSEGCLPLQKTAFLTSCIFLTSVHAELGEEMWVMKLLVSCACQLLFCTWALLAQVVGDELDCESGVGEVGTGNPHLSQCLKFQYPAVKSRLFFSFCLCKQCPTSIWSGEKKKKEGVVSYHPM